MIERSPAFAHPADDLRRDPGNESVRRDILRYDRAGRNHSISPDGEAAQNRGVCTNGGSVLHGCGHDLPVRVDSPRIDVIRKARVRADENTIADPQPLVKGGEVLDFAAVPHDHTGIDVHVFPNAAVPPNVGPLSNLGPMPD